MEFNLRLDLLTKKGDYLVVADLTEIFGCSRKTIWKYETQGIDGFPRSVYLMGKKCWPKKSILDYIDRKKQVALKYSQLVARNVRS